MCPWAPASNPFLGSLVSARLAGFPAEVMERWIEVTPQLPQGRGDEMPGPVSRTDRLNDPLFALALITTSSWYRPSPTKRPSPSRTFDCSMKSRIRA
jgi:hypothetical protein